MRIIEKFNRQFEYAGLLITIIIAFQFYRLWQYPQIDDGSKIATMSLLMAFEFIMVHSGVFMAVMPKKISLYFLFPFYLLFALAFNFATEDNSILILYLVAIFNRMRFAFADVSKKIKEQNIFKSVLAALAYFVLIFPFAFGAEYVPVGGMQSEKMNAIGYPGDTGASGLFVEMPHVAISFGFAYHCILAIIEAFAMRANFGAPFIKHN
ncbi:hypothetical protein [Pseudozobellia sp. WGM2]|uniref:hypothetical protein n=1 Tax=Pseudozobellia sp. WGM2 TaxID=2787625 RepID=UPI001AE082DC|nr:hypothetical protein [Pseudozobellia sp. WGM2]